MDPITQAIIGVSMQIVGLLFQPKPEKPKPPALEDFEEPTADVARPIPVIFGTVIVTGPNSLWWGEKSTEKREVKIPTAKK